MIKKRTVVRNSDFAPGDIFKMNPNPIKGHEQKGYRPFIVLSNVLQEVSPHMLFVAPITSKTKVYPLHVPLVTKHTIVTGGVVLCEHVRTIDVMAYGTSFTILDEATEACLSECKKIIHSF